jgi:hypothetical protein
MNFTNYLSATTTANPCGTPVSVGNSSVLFSTSSTNTSYTCQYFEWMSPTTGSITLAFQFRNDPGWWYMDDVSVSDGTNEMLVNGGFESGSFSPGWITGTPNGACTPPSSGAQIVNSSCYSGSYCVTDGCVSDADQISQTFPATAGQFYYVSFWLLCNDGGYGGGGYGGGGYGGGGYGGGGYGGGGHGGGYGSIYASASLS